MLTPPWSKRHKAVTKNDKAGLRYNLSNSFAQPTSMAELEDLARKRGDEATVEDYRTHALGCGSRADGRRRLGARRGRAFVPVERNRP